MSKRKQDNFGAFLRGFSIMTIVLFHFLRLVPFPYFLSKSIQLGGTGVHVFLFLSGFGLSLSTYKGWTDFLKKRFVKVLIPYYVGIILIYFINVLTEIYPNGLATLISSLFLYKMFIEAYTRNFGGHFWFISTIVQFYLAFPLILYVYNLLGWKKILSASVLISIAYTLIIIALEKESYRIWNSFFLQYLWEFVLGMAVAQNQWLKRWLSLPWYSILGICVGGLALTGVLYQLGGKSGQVLNDFFAFFGYLSGATLFYLLFKNNTYFIRFFGWIESVSFSVYIMHMLPINLYMVYIGRKTLTLFEVPLLLATSFLVSICFDFLIKRMMAALNRESILK